MPSRFHTNLTFEDAWVVCKEVPYLACGSEASSVHPPYCSPRSYFRAPRAHNPNLLQDYRCDNPGIAVRTEGTAGT